MTSRGQQRSKLRDLERRAPASGRVSGRPHRGGTAPGDRMTTPMTPGRDSSSTAQGAPGARTSTCRWSCGRERVPRRVRQWRPHDEASHGAVGRLPPETRCAKGRISRAMAFVIGPPSSLAIALASPAVSDRRRESRVWRIGGARRRAGRDSLPSARVSRAWCRGVVSAGSSDVATAHAWTSWPFRGAVDSVSAPAVVLRCGCSCPAFRQ